MVLALLVGACADPPGKPVPAELRELERLAFVPAATCYLLTFSADPNADCSIHRAIVMDLYELTRGELVALYEANAPGRRPRAETHAWETGQALRHEDTSDWPAFLSATEAQEVAAWRGMRLPTWREWIHVAVGRRGFAFPWGRDQSSVSNTAEANIGRPTPVGTFENGRSVPFGCYDMIGNVWEWVSDAVPGYLDSSYDLARMARREMLLGPDARVSVLGGSFGARRRATFGALRRDNLGVILAFQASLTHPDTLSPEIGVRLCADAEPFLWDKARAVGESPRVRERLRAIGRRWALDPIAKSGLIDLLQRLLEREGASPALGWILEGARGDASATYPQAGP